MYKLTTKLVHELTNKCADVLCKTEPHWIMLDSPLPPIALILSDVASHCF